MEVIIETNAYFTKLDKPCYTEDNKEVTTSGLSVSN